MQVIESHFADRIDLVGPNQEVFDQRGHRALQVVVVAEPKVHRKDLLLVAEEAFIS